MIPITEHPICVLLIGAAASGKTTFANEYLLSLLKEHGRNVVIISKDQKRNEKTTERGTNFEQFNRNKTNHLELEQALEKMIREATQANHDIVVDRVNSTVKYRQATMKAIPSHYKKIAIIFEPQDIGTLFMRSLGRDVDKITKGQQPYLIPVRAIKEKLDKLELPTRAEGFDEILRISFEKEIPEIKTNHNPMAR